MQVEFLVHFQRDLGKIHQAHVKQAIKRTIQQVESSKRIQDVANVKKLSGHKSAYRIRIGDFRIGIFVVGNVAEFSRVVHRKDIYKLFP